MVLTAASTCCLRTLGIFKVMNAYEIGSHFLRWALNDESRAAALDPAHRSDLDWLRVAPFALLHVLCLAAIWTGISSTAFFVAVGLYVLRMFAITAFYHRYFSHRAYRVGRVTFLMAVLGCMLANADLSGGPGIIVSITHVRTRLTTHTRRASAASGTATSSGS